jgi:hypothetical protein
VENGVVALHEKTFVVFSLGVGYFIFPTGALGRGQTSEIKYLIKKDKQQ